MISVIGIATVESIKLFVTGFSLGLTLMNTTKTINDRTNIKAAESLINSLEEK